MVKYGYKDLIKFLEEAIKYMKYYNKEYDNRLINGKPAFTMKRRLDYHIFSFSQIFFALRDRLRTDYPRKKSIINKFFGYRIESPKTESGIVMKLANEWKHEGFNITQAWSRGKEIDKVKIKDLPIPQHIKDTFPNKDKEVPVLTPTKVDKHLPVKHKFNRNNKKIIDIFEDALNEVKEFISKMCAS